MDAKLRYVCSGMSGKSCDLFEEAHETCGLNHLQTNLSNKTYNLFKTLIMRVGKCIHNRNGQTYQI